ncbi:MAG TPA: division/cell wall cluster transcriptional repressor MraZ, partial [Pseudomonadales bacterium]|nr:division/cell wall cluster transcriptional repressor MraZ [Pseudomonadales bacterium]
VASFRGIKEVSLDSKWRLAIPTRFRDVAQEICGLELILNVNPFNRCITVYPIKEWERIEAQISTYPDAIEDQRAMRNLLMGYATELELDSAGRFVVPPMHRKYAGIEKDAVVVGKATKFEIWNAERWHASTEQTFGDGLIGEKPLSEEVIRLVI